MVKRLLQGNEACIAGALAAGMDFYAGYPITPSTEITELAARELPRIGGTYMQMEDEIASIAAAIGASMTGAKAMTATSGPGFSLMQEMIGYGVMAEAPVVIVVVMRVGPSTGLPTASAQGDVMQVRWGTHGDHPMICLCPTTVEETYYLTIEAFHIAQRYRTPVVLLTDATLGHMRESVTVSADGTQQNNEKVGEPFISDDHAEAAKVIGAGQHLHVTGLVHDGNGFPTNSPDLAGALLRRLNEKITVQSADLLQYEEDGCFGALWIVVAYGSVVRIARHVVRRLQDEGFAIGLFAPKIIWPFPADALARLLTGRVEKIIVAEQNLGQYTEAVRAHASKSGVETVACVKIGGEPFLSAELYSKIRAEMIK